jgi:hypothetical protein
VSQAVQISASGARQIRSKLPRRQSNKSSYPTRMARLPHVEGCRPSLRRERRRRLKCWSRVTTTNQYKTMPHTVRAMPTRPLHPPTSSPLQTRCSGPAAARHSCMTRLHAHNSIGAPNSGESCRARCLQCFCISTTRRSTTRHGILFRERLDWQCIMASASSSFTRTMKRTVAATSPGSLHPAALVDLRTAHCNPRE